MRPHFQKVDFGHSFRYAICEKDAQGSLHILQGPFVIQTVPPNETISSDDELHCSPAEVQALMDNLWEEGVRPTEHVSQDHLAAIKQHLVAEQDMRSRLMNKFVFKEKA